MQTFPDAAYWIKHLNLSKHIEGGYFTEVYKSGLKLPSSQLPDNFPKQEERHICTHIYFLLEKNDFSALHRIKSDELWHFYAGAPLIVYEIQETGKLIEHILGNNPLNNQQLFTAIKAGSWFGAKLQEESEYALVGCTVSPGFDYADFELGKREELLQKFPQYKKVIMQLTR